MAFPRNTKTGKRFEEKVNFIGRVGKTPGYRTEKKYGKRWTNIYYKGKLTAVYFEKGGFYDYMKEEHGIEKAGLSAYPNPDGGLFSPHNKHLFIFEMKQQQCQGTADEKLQTFEFKHEQYKKLMKGTGITTSYSYVLNDWFRQPQYKDVLNFIEKKGYRYFFNRIPFYYIGFKESKASCA